MLRRVSSSLPGAVLVVGLAGTLVAGCGEDAPDGDDAVSAATQACRDTWADVAQTVIGLDEATLPSALPDRWSSVVATIEVYRTSAKAKDCEANVAVQKRAIEALRKFADQVRPYDMEYQAQRIGPAVDLYLHDPLPEPVEDAQGKLVKPPSKEEVEAAYDALVANAATANEEIAPGWEQAEAIDLNDADAVAKALEDLDFLGQDSPAWRHCQEALQVLVAAVRAQEGLAPTAAGDG